MSKHDLTNVSAIIANVWGVGAVLAGDTKEGLYCFILSVVWVVIMLIAFSWDD